MHHYIGMINRHSAGGGLEHHRGIAHRIGPLLYQFGVGAGREAGVGNQVLAVQHQRPGPFQESADIFHRSHIHYPFEAVSQQGVQKLCTLPAAVWRKHGVEYQCVTVGGDAVVGEDRIGCCRLRRVLHDIDGDAVAAQHRYVAVEFFYGPLGDFALYLVLEGVVFCGFFVKGKALRPHHQYMVGGLFHITNIQKKPAWKSGLIVKMVNAKEVLPQSSMIRDPKSSLKGDSQ